MKVPAEEETCHVNGCDKVRYGRGLCQPHYLRWWRTGDPLPPRVPIHRTNLPWRCV